MAGAGPALATIGPSQENDGSESGRNPGVAGTVSVDGICVLDRRSLLPAGDLDLLNRARQGDAGAFHALVDRHAKTLFGLAYSLLGNTADAEDVLQETLLG